MARELAEIFWLRVAMPETNRAAIAGKLKHLSPLQHSMYPDMLVVVGRAVTGFKQFFQKSYLPILMSGTRTAFLIMLWAHNLDHAGVDITFQTALQLREVQVFKRETRGSADGNTATVPLSTKSLLHLRSSRPGRTLPGEEGRSIKGDQEEHWNHEGLGRPHSVFTNQSC